MSIFCKNLWDILSSKTRECNFKIFKFCWFKQEYQVMQGLNLIWNEIVFGTQASSKAFLTSASNSQVMRFLVSKKWPCNFNVQIRPKCPIFRLFTPHFQNLHTWIELKQLSIFSPSKVSSFPCSEPGLSWLLMKSE